MADCYYHGPSGPGPCSDCERAGRLSVAEDELDSTQTPMRMEVQLALEDAMMQKQKNSGLESRD